MALGDLSPDQTRFATTVAQSTGLDPGVVRAWIGAESGWGVYKPGHNYLNIGPGRQYTSVDQAAQATGKLIGSSPYYAGIRSAVPAGAGAQVAAIQASPWDAAHYGGHRLADVWHSLVGQGGTAPPGPQPGDLHANVVPVVDLNPLHHLPGLSDLGSGAAGAIADAVLPGVASIALTSLFATAALGLIALGLYRLTGNNTRDLFHQVSGVVGQAGQAATLAAL